MKLKLFVGFVGFVVLFTSPLAQAAPKGRFALEKSCGMSLGTDFYGFYKGGDAVSSPLLVRVGDKGIRVVYRSGRPEFFSWDDMALEAKTADYLFSFRVTNKVATRFRFTQDLDTGNAVIQFEYFAKGQRRGFRAQFTSEIPRTSLAERARAFYGIYASQDGRFEFEISPGGVKVEKGFGRKPKFFPWTKNNRAASSTFERQGRRPALIFSLGDTRDFLSIELPNGGVRRVRLLRPSLTRAWEFDSFTAEFQRPLE